MKDAPITLIAQDIPRTLGALCQEQIKSSDIFLIINHNLTAGLRMVGTLQVAVMGGEALINCWLKGAGEGSVTETWKGLSL